MEDLSVKMRKGGRITIPATLRKKFGIKDGTRINIFLDEKLQRIILAPLTRECIHRLCGILKPKKGEKSMLQLLLEDRAEDLKREEAKMKRYNI